MDPFGRWNATLTYTYRGQDAQDPSLARIQVGGAVGYDPPARGEGFPLIVGGSFKSTNVSGVLLFDLARGRLARADTSVTVAGTFDMDADGKTVKVPMTQTQRRRVTITDVSPLKP